MTLLIANGTEFNSCLVRDSRCWGKGARGGGASPCAFYTLSIDQCHLYTVHWTTSVRGAPDCRVGHKAGICCIQASPIRETMIYTGCYDDKLRLWDLRNLSDPLAQVREECPRIARQNRWVMNHGHES